MKQINKQVVKVNILCYNETRIRGCYTLLPKKAKRFIVYPIMFIGIGLFLNEKYPEILQYFPTFKGIPDIVAISVFLYFVGYVYGTLSLIIPVHEIKSLLVMAVFFVLKMMLVIYLYTFAIYFYVFELSVMGIKVILKQKKVELPSIKFSREGISKILKPSKIESSHEFRY